MSYPIEGICLRYLSVDVSLDVIVKRLDIVLEPIYISCGLAVRYEAVTQYIEETSYRYLFYPSIEFNLILNSLLHGFDNQPGGTINIDISTNGQRIQIDYRDNGVGMNPDWHTKLFEPFMTTRRNQGCSGLGMHIVYNLVSQLLQGHIESLPSDCGAHFHIDLPLMPGPVAAD